MLKGSPSNRGQVLIIFVFAIIGLIGITGLAIDGGNIYSDRRNAQNAADTAALTAALTRNIWEKSSGTCHATINTATGTLPGCAPDTVNNALTIASKNGYDNNPADQNRVDVYSPPIDGAYSNCGQASYDCHNYIEVIIKDDVNTWFARVLGIAQLHNKVEAVVLAKYIATHSLYGGATMASLQPSGCSTFDVTGTAGLTLNNGANIFVNSNSTSASCGGSNNGAFIVQHCGELTINPQGPVGVVGGSSVPTCTAPDQTTTTTSAPAVQWPPDPIFDTPSECNDPYASLNGTWNSLDNTWHYQPGHYTSLPPDKNSTLESGVYCVDSLIKTTSNTATLYGTGVFLWIKPHGYFDFEGGTTILSAPTSGTYAGYLMYVDWDDTVTPGTDTCTINGNGTSSYTGTIFAPYCHIKLNGTSDVGGWQAQMIGYNFIVNGTTSIVFDRNGTPNAMVPEYDRTGLYH